MVTQQGKVLFVCLHGSAKSLIAAEYFNRLAAARGLGARATSAGTEPDDVIPPRVIQGLRADGIDVEGRRPQRPTSAGPRWHSSAARCSPRCRASGNAGG